MSTSHPPRRTRPLVLKSNGGLTVSWNAPANSGPPILGYELEYRTRGSESWIAGDEMLSTRRTTLTGLESNTVYEVQVRALNDEGTSPWSAPGAGRTPVAQLTVSYSAAAYTVPEGGEAIVTLLLTPAADREVAIPVVSASTTEAFAATATFEPGQSSASFSFTAPQDEDVNDETLTLSFGPLPEAVGAGDPDTAVVTTEDDDRASQTRMSRLNEEILGRQALRVMSDVNLSIANRLESMGSMGAGGQEQELSIADRSRWSAGSLLERPVSPHGTARDDAATGCIELPAVTCSGWRRGRLDSVGRRQLQPVVE